MRSEARLAAASFAFLVATGCSGPQRLDVEGRATTDAQRARQDKICFGVVVSREVPPPYSIGLKVERVLKETGASESGIQPQDELRSVASQVVPIIGHGISLFELERCPYHGASRVLLVMWPLRFTSISDEDANLVLAAGEESLEVY